MRFLEVLVVLVAVSTRLTVSSSDYYSFNDHSRPIEIDTEFSMEIRNDKTSASSLRDNRRTRPLIRRSWTENYNQANHEPVDRQGYGGGGGNCGGCGGCCSVGASSAVQQPNLISLLSLLFSILLPLLFLIYYISQNTDNGNGGRGALELIESYPVFPTWFPDG